MIRRAVAILSAGFLALPVQAAETTITLQVEGQEIIGTLETPDGPPAPVVLMLHGFTGTRDELPVNGTDEGVFARTAAALAENGFASLRIDFRGSGESAGAWEDTTFSSQIRDAVTAIDALQTMPDVDGEALAVLGWSQGGLIAAHAAAARPEIDALVLWAPVVHPRATYTGLLGAETTEEAMAAPADKPYTGMLPWGVETTLKAAFFHELATTSTAAAVAAYPGPLQVVIGSRDTLITPPAASAEMLIAYHKGQGRFLYFDTDHVWDAFTGPEVIDTKMIPSTLEWLNDHVVFQE